MNPKSYFNGKSYSQNKSLPENGLYKSEFPPENLREDPFAVDEEERFGRSWCRVLRLELCD